MIVITLPNGGTGYFTARFELSGSFGVDAPANLYDPARYSGQDGNYLLSRVIGGLTATTSSANPATSSFYEASFSDYLYAHIAGGSGSLSSTVNSFTRLTVGGNVNSQGPTATPFGSYTASFVFESGVPFDFIFGSTCFVQAFSGASADCDLGHTARFTGIENVRDRQGNSLSGYAISSASGLDFAAGYPGGFSGGVPEPATWGMMVLGFALIGSEFRRRRRPEPRAARATG